MSFDLRPLTLGELLDRSFSLYRRHFWLFVGLMAIPSIFTLFIGVAGQVVPAMLAVPGMGPPGIDEPDIDGAAVAKMLGFLVIFLVGFLVLMVAYWIAYMVTLGAVTVAVSDLYVGRTATIASSYAQVRRRIGRLLMLFLLIGLRMIGLFLAITVLVALVTFIGFMISREAAGVLGVIGVFLGMMISTVASTLYLLRCAVSVPVLVLEDVKASAALRRSVALTRGNLGRTFVLILFTVMITYAAMALLQGPFVVGAMVAGPESRMGFWLNLAGAVTGTLAGAVTGPLMIIALALLYYDVRIRREGLDLDMMIASLDPHGPPSASTSLTPAG